MRFRDEPSGKVALKKRGLQILRIPPEPGVMVKDVCKSVFSEEPVRKIPGRGQYWEIRIDDWAGGQLCLWAVGFTSTDPETLLNEDGTNRLPPRAHEIPKTYIVGYHSMLYWDGEAVEAKPFKTVSPLKVFRIGVLATLTGCLEIYMERKLLYSFDPAEEGLQPIDSEGQLWAVMDTASGIRKATLLPNVRPPEEGEEDVAAGEEGDDG